MRCRCEPSHVSRTREIAVQEERERICRAIGNLVLTFDYDRAGYQKAIEDVLALIQVEWPEGQDD